MIHSIRVNIYVGRDIFNIRLDMYLSYKLSLRIMMTFLMMKQYIETKQCTSSYFIPQRIPVNETNTQNIFIFSRFCKTIAWIFR